MGPTTAVLKYSAAARGVWTAVPRAWGNNMKKFWRLWAKALGEKAGATDREADQIALIRTAIVAGYMTTNLFIVAGVIRHW